MVVVVNVVHADRASVWSSRHSLLSCLSTSSLLSLLRLGEGMVRINVAQCTVVFFPNGLRKSLFYCYYYYCVVVEVADLAVLA